MLEALVVLAVLQTVGIGVLVLHVLQDRKFRNLFPVGTAVKTCHACRFTVHVDARRCPHCTSILAV